MNFEIEQTQIPGILIIHGKRFFDNRGFFSEIYRQDIFKELEIPEFIQDNLSTSAKGVIRGLHWQSSPFGQGKLVQCINGAILDVAVDIRKESKTFGQHVTIELNDGELKLAWIPEGFAHGFQSLTDKTIVLYKVTNIWNQQSEKSLNYADKEVGIRWAKIDPVVSEKDIFAPMLNELA